MVGTTGQRTSPPWLSDVDADPSPTARQAVLRLGTLISLIVAIGLWLWAT